MNSWFWLATLLFMFVAASGLHGRRLWMSMMLVCGVSMFVFASPRRRRMNLAELANDIWNNDGPLTAYRTVAIGTALMFAFACTAAMLASTGVGSNRPGRPAQLGTNRQAVLVNRVPVPIEVQARYAVHETGHAVCAFRFGRTLTDLWIATEIDPNNEGVGGRCDWATDEDSAFAPTTVYMFETVTIALAGLEAEQLVYGNTASYGGRDDMAKVRNIVAALGSDGASMTSGDGVRIEFTDTDAVIALARRHARVQLVADLGAVRGIADQLSNAPDVDSRRTIAVDGIRFEEQWRSTATPLHVDENALGGVVDSAAVLAGDRQGLNPGASR